jgi:hypothetical protein
VRGKHVGKRIKSFGKRGKCVGKQGEQAIETASIQSVK